MANNTSIQNRGRWLTEAKASRGVDRNFKGLASMRNPQALYNSRSARLMSETINKTRSVYIL